MFTMEDLKAIGMLLGFFITLFGAVAFLVSPRIKK